MTDITTTRSFAITRHFAASRSAVFRAWTDPAELGWFLNPEQAVPDQPIEVDLRVGGAWRVPMVIDEETAYTTGGVYLEIVPDERLVFAWGAVDGWPHVDLDDLGAGPIARLELAEADGGTDATLTVELPERMSDADVSRWLGYGIREGWTDTFERLDLPA